MQPQAANVDRVRTVLAVALSTLAGAVDALGFIALGGFFVSFMTGNTTRLAVGFADGRLHEAAIGATLILLFVAGGIVGFATARAVRSRPKQAVAALLTGLLLAAALCHDTGADPIAVAAMTIAMGAENAIFQSQSGKSIGLTYMTGALVKMSSHIVDALTGGPRLAWFGQFVLWAGLAIGAVLGGLTDRWIGLDALWLVAVAAAVIAVLLGRVPADA